MSSWFYAVLGLHAPNNLWVLGLSGARCSTDDYRQTRGGDLPSGRGGKRHPHHHRGSADEPHATHAARGRHRLPHEPRGVPGRRLRRPGRGRTSSAGVVVVGRRDVLPQDAALLRRFDPRLHVADTTPICLREQVPVGVSHQRPRRALRRRKGDLICLFSAGRRRAYALCNRHHRRLLTVRARILTDRGDFLNIPGVDIFSF